MEQEALASLWTCVGRKSDYAVQQRDGRYFRARKPITDAILARHLAGQICIGTYVRDEDGRCSFAVFDADQRHGLKVLSELQAELARQGFPAYLERSRRGGHLWLFFQEPWATELVRAWLLPLATARQLELFPKQGGNRGIGSLIRLPLGIHQRSKQRYPFLNPNLQPVARTLHEQLLWLAGVERVQPPSIDVPPTLQLPPPAPTLALTHIDKNLSIRSIHDWNAAQDPFTLIGRYVALDHNGSGHCPFGEHHQDGHDTHASFRVFSPLHPGGTCWYCYVWERGGNAFDFLCYRFHLDAKALWHRILDDDLP